MKTQKRGPSKGLTIPVASVIKNFKGRCIPVLCLPVFDTTSPGEGDCLNRGWLGRTWEFHPARIAPSRPQAGVSLCADEVIAKQLVRCFWTGGYRSPPYLAVFDGHGHCPQVVLAHPPSALGPAGNVFRIGYDRARPGVFQGAEDAYRHPRKGKNCTRILFSTIKSLPARVGFNRWSSSSCLGDSVWALG